MRGERRKSGKHVAIHAVNIHLLSTYYVLLCWVTETTRKKAVPHCVHILARKTEFEQLKMHQREL